MTALGAAVVAGMCLLLPDLDDAVLRAGNRALDEQQVLLRVDLVDEVRPELGAEDGRLERDLLGLLAGGVEQRSLNGGGGYGPSPL